MTEPGTGSSSEGDTGADGSATTSERDAEVERLRAEVEALRAHEAGGASRRRRRIPWGTIARRTLFLVGCLLAIFSVLIIWVRDELLDTNTYVDTMAPLASSPAVQSAIANDVSNQLFAKVDVQTKVKDALPPSADFLAAPLTNQLKSFTDSAAKKLVSSDKFQNLWVNANRRAHNAIVAVLTGEQKGRVSTAGGKVTLDLSSVTNQLQGRLQSSGVSAFQNVNLGNGQIVLFSSPDLQKVQSATRVLKGLAFVFPVLALGCFAGAIALSKDRRKGLLRTALALSISMVVLLALMALLRQIFLNEVSSPSLPSDAASDIYNALVAFVRRGAIVAFAVGVVVALGAALAGPSRAAVTTRRTVRGGLDSLRGSADARGWDFGPVGLWVGRHRGALRIGVLIGAFVVLVAWSQPTAWVVLALALIVAVLFGLIELLGRAPPDVDEGGTSENHGQQDAAVQATGSAHEEKSTNA